LPSEKIFLQQPDLEDISPLTPGEAAIFATWCQILFGLKN
jgi:hypothetical protein